MDTSDKSHFTSTCENSHCDGGWMTHSVVAGQIRLPCPANLFHWAGADEVRSTLSHEIMEVEQQFGE
jgi:hypothetical protein